MSGSVCVCVQVRIDSDLSSRPPLSRSLSLNPQCQTDAAVFYQLVSLSILNPKSNLSLDAEATSFKCSKRSSSFFFLWVIVSSVGSLCLCLLSFSSYRWHKQARRLFLDSVLNEWPWAINVRSLLSVAFFNTTPPRNQLHNDFCLMFRRLVYV